jgi:poly-beta-hydroxyalkanoate depolymerase
LPGSVPKLYFEKAPGESRANMIAQALPAEHIHDTLTRVFREFWLPRGEYMYDGQRIDTLAITCRVMTFAGKKDKICPPEQTHDLVERLTPHADFHSAQTLADKGHYQMVGAEVMQKVIAPSIAQAVRAKRETKIFNLVA